MSTHRDFVSEFILRAAMLYMVVAAVPLYERLLASVFMPLHEALTLVPGVI